MMTNRSNHMPTFTKRDRIQTIVVFWRTPLNQKNCGVITLHEIMIQYDQAKGPNARLMKVKPSYGLAPYHAMKNSIAYAYPTIVPVAKVILHMQSMWYCVIRSSRR